jgi:hypothetical protein
VEKYSFKTKSAPSVQGSKHIPMAFSEQSASGTKRKFAADPEYKTYDLEFGLTVSIRACNPEKHSLPSIHLLDSKSNLYEAVHCMERVKTAYTDREWREKYTTLYDPDADLKLMEKQNHLAYEPANKTELRECILTSSQFVHACIQKDTKVTAYRFSSTRKLVWLLASYKTEPSKDVIGCTHFITARFQLSELLNAEPCKRLTSKE